MRLSHCFVSTPPRLPRFCSVSVRLAPHSDYTTLSCSPRQVRTVSHMIGDLQLTLKQGSSWLQLAVRKQLKTIILQCIEREGDKTNTLLVGDQASQAIYLANVHPNMIPLEKLPLSGALRAHPAYPLHCDPDWIAGMLPSTNAEHISNACWLEMVDHPKFTPQFVMDYVPNPGYFGLRESRAHKWYYLSVYSALWVVHNKQIGSWPIESQTTSRDDLRDYPEYRMSSVSHWHWRRQLKWRYEFFECDCLVFCSVAVFKSIVHQILI